jgi:6-phosphogluconate dehydrogenase
MFREEQIYRIDHYLAKEALQNILTFRFANDIFENVWSSEYIERIDIRGWETLGVESRGNFYDGIGALRDVGQNHLLQMLALITMDHPGSLSSEAIRRARFDLVQQLRLPNETHVRQRTFRAQYEGYQTIAGVQPDSKTETYFKAEVGLVHPKWRGVPVMIEWGKRMGEVKKDIVVTFKHVTPCLCPPEGHRQNTVTFSLEPEEKISVSLWAKQPGLSYQMAPKSLEFSLRGTEQRTQYVEEYEKLLLDAVQGDQTLFVSTEEVRAMWQAVDPIVEAWQKDVVPLAMYKPDTNEATEAADAALGKCEYKRLGIIGLGKMGANLARRMLEKNWQVVGYNRTVSVAEAMRSEGLIPAPTIPNVVHQLQTPRVVWLMVPAGKPVDEHIDALIPLLAPGDTVIDGGNSNYADAKGRAERLSAHGIAYMDVGTSGGPGGARKGPSLMIGGRQEDFDRLEYLFSDMAGPGSYQFFRGYGAGHFVKMVHNGIEYGMMQALAEGVSVLRAAEYNLDLTKVADIYNHGSVIESRLVGWLAGALSVHGPNMDGVTGTVAHTGEGQWTVDAADALGVKADIIRRSLEFRKESATNPSYTGQVLSALREQFGGHAVQ